MALKISSKMTVSLPNLDFTKVLEEVAEKIIILDMRLGINRGIGIDGGPFPPLEASTIAHKIGARKSARKAGGLGKAGLASSGRQILVDTGELRESFEHERVKTNHVRIVLRSPRAKIGYYLQVEGVGKKKKKFDFFGISQRAELQAIAKMNGELVKILRPINGR